MLERGREGRDERLAVDAFVLEQHAKDGSEERERDLVRLRLPSAREDEDPTGRAPEREFVQ